MSQGKARPGSFSQGWGSGVKAGLLLGYPSRKNVSLAGRAWEGIYRASWWEIDTLRGPLHISRHTLALPSKEGPFLEASTKCIRGT